ncbi:MAG: hypothetical protein ACJ74W_19210 [Pyrinomonadaceae bacterium]
MIAEQNKRAAIIVSAILLTAIGLTGIFCVVLVRNIDQLIGTPAARKTNKAVTDARAVNIMGTWLGYNSRSPEPVTLIIDHQAGQSFSGTISQRNWRVAVTGSIDSATRQITIDDSRVLTQNVRADGVWSLAERKGLISVDGEQMSVAGEDEYGTVSATFVRQH